MPHVQSDFRPPSQRGSLEQIRRARVLLDAASSHPETVFFFLVGALQLARAVPEYWYTIARLIPTRLHKPDEQATEKRLVTEFVQTFEAARRYTLLTELRNWDFHWEPLMNPAAIAPDFEWSRGAPVVLSTGPNPKSSAALLPGNKVITTGSGRRVGRSNYYTITQCRYVDFERSEAVPLDLAIREFLDDLPGCVAKILEKPEVVEYLKTL